MTKARRNIQAILEKTGLYQFDGGILAGEMAAYEVGFKLAEDAIKALLSDLFIETASETVLLAMEKIFRAIPAAVEPAMRRKMLLARWGDYSTNAALPRFQKLLAAAGVEGTLREETTQSRLVVQAAKLNGVTAEQAQQELEQLMPAHLIIEMQA